LVPHDGHDHARIDKGNLSTTCPQPEHALLDGKNRSIVTTVFPYRAAFASIKRQAEPIAASLNA